VDIENCRVIKVSGNKCPKGEGYAASEIENPLRILTSAVLSEDLLLKMIPVRTDKPIPKSRILDAMAEIKKLRVSRPLRVGEVIVNNFLGLGANLIATRDIKKGES
jgi:CxxC motif-containing protein